MAEIKELPPGFRIQPGLPGSATDKDRQVPVKPLVKDEKDKQKRRKRQPDDKDEHLDEYA